MVSPLARRAEGGALPPQRVCLSVGEMKGRSVCIGAGHKTKAPANQPGAFDGALLVPLRRYGVRLPNQMKLLPLPSATVMDQPKPVAHVGPFPGKVWCQPACTVSQTV